MPKGFKLASRSLFLVFCSISMIAMLSGCLVRTYSLTKDRVDQELGTGNRGYLKGQPPRTEETERKKTRTTHVVEIELRSPVKFEKIPKDKTQAQAVQQAMPEKEEVAGNRGYITQELAPEIEENKVATQITFEKYTVQKTDTLQKISHKFYGTSKKWTKIYEANKTVLKGPDKIYPGQVLSIPVEKSAEHIK